MNRDVAIVGMGCRFPQAPDLGAYWRNICEARVCFSDIPADRWNHALFYDPSPRAIDKTYARKVGMLDEVRSFAAMHYGLAPLRVSVMDPQHRLLLDTVRVALEDAGYADAAIAGSRTGVFVGASVSEYKDLITSRLRARSMFDGEWGRAPAATREIVDAIVEDVMPLRAFTIAGNLLNMAAATVAQAFDLRGPAFTIDAACSSSLVAACDAVIHLRAGVCDLAIAGGVYLNLTPDNLVGFSRIGAISPSDACRPFDERADGFVLGEGVGAVVLKRLDDALRDRDRIYAVIRGVGINNDGRGEGPMTPRLEGQLDALARAYSECDFTPDTIGFVEAHGTATSVGDAVEIGALRRYFSESAKAPIDCFVSSVKANIGHTMSAAGVAGLIKTALVVDRAVAPPQAGFERTHDKLALRGSGFRIATKLQPFERTGGPRRAAVSSFGFGGTNCHIILEQAPEIHRQQKARVADAVGVPQPEAFFVSAATPELLDGHLAAIASAIHDEVPLADVSHTLATRTRFDVRVGFVARTHGELRTKLESARVVVRSGASQSGIWFAVKALPPDERRIAFLFPGQGAQTIGLCQGLYERFSAFRANLDQLASYLDDLLERPLLSYLYPHRNGARFDEVAAMRALTATEVCQPAMATLGLAVFKFVEQLGIVPAMFVGHSLGEFTALAAGDALSPRDAVRFVARRGRIMAEVALVDRGAMSAIQNDRGFVDSHLRDTENVVVANINHPKQTVISGATDDVLAISARIAATGAHITRLAVSHAFHSPLLAITNAPIAELVAGLDVQPHARTVISCIVPGPYPEDPSAVREIMLRHATATVDFVAGIRAVAAAGARVLVQVAAGTSLLAMARATLRADDTQVTAATSLAGLGDDDGGQLIEALVELSVLGVPVALHVLHEDASLAWLPPTPLPTERYWCATKSDRERTSVPALGTTGDNDATLSLFREQMAVLQTHAEIIRRQTELLAGSRPAATEIEVNTSVALGVHDNPPAQPTPVIVPPEPQPAPTLTDDVDGKLLEIISEVSSFPRTGLAPTQRLVADLGFDSLMIVELAGKTSDAFVGLTGLPKTLFAGEATIADIATYIRNAMRKTPPAASAVTRSTTIARFTPKLVERRSTALRDAVPPFHGPIAIIADTRGIAAELARRLTTVGVAVEVVAAAPTPTARGIVDLRALDNPASDPLALDANALRSALAATLSVARQFARGTPPSLFAISYASDADAAVAGFVKALAREWPDTRCKAIAIDATRPADELAQRLFDELVATDATVEVALVSRQRAVVELEPIDSIERIPLRERSVIAITGGGRGLGAKIALELAHRYHARLVLLGRAVRDARIDELLTSIVGASGEAIYIRCDVRDTAAVATALDEGRRRFGGIEVVVHAAGIIADAPVGKKDPTRFAEVFDTKVAGWLALERATRTDPVRVALALGSWSGRFGNAEQTDYAAANHLVAVLASAWGRARPETRAVALDLPPWEGSAMASTIPNGLRTMMRANGVTFLDDRAGLDVVLGELEATGSSGEILVGHDVAVESANHARVRLALETHPYLADHRIAGVPVLPLAAATDYLAGAATRLLGAPITVVDLELIEGVRIVDGPLQLDIRARGRQHSTRALDEVEVELALGSGKLAYRARARRSPGLLAALEIPTAVEPPPLALDEFYARHTFHGPRLRGIASIEGLDARHIIGTVRAARLGELGDRLGDFTIDPLVVDASFQLAAYFILVRHGRAGLPLGFDELRVLAPIEPGSHVRCVVRLEAQSSDLFVGHIDYLDRMGKLVAQLRGVRGAFRIAEQAPTERVERVEIPAAHYTIEEFPEYVALRERITEVDTSGIDNPYFNVHERVTNDTTVIAGREVINFSSYNYVGLSGDPAVSRAAIEAVGKYGTSVSASRIASGEKPVHLELEARIARFLGCEDSIVMVGGHATNVSVIGHMVGPGDLVMHDSLAHDSILGGVKLSGARRRPFAHNDWRALDEALTQVRGSFRRVLIAIEGVYSMDGDIPDLPRFIEIKRRHKALMLVDEAHSLGVLGTRGAGIGELFNVDRRDVELWMGTLSKSLASCGGYIAGSHALVEYLKYTNPGFVYSVGISPANAAAALAALRELEARPKLVATVQARARLFLNLCRERGINTGTSDGSAVVPCIVGDSVRCMLVSQALAQSGINVQPIIYPAVEEHLARLRFFISARHTEAQLRFTADLLGEIYATFNRTPVRHRATSDRGAPVVATID